MDHTTCPTTGGIRTGTRLGHREDTVESGKYVLDVLFGTFAEEGGTQCEGDVLTAVLSLCFCVDRGTLKTRLEVIRYSMSEIAASS